MGSVLKICRTMFISCLMPLLPLTATWSPPTLLSVPGENAGNYGSPTLAVNTLNNGVAIWQAVSPSNPFGYADIQSSFYTFGIGWSSPQIISSLSPIYEVQGDPQISMNNLNYCVGVWEGFEVVPIVGGIQAVYAATRDPSGTWSSVQRMSAFNVTDGSFFPSNPSSAVNDAGLAISAWVELRTDDTINAFYYLMGSFLSEGGSWSTPIQLAGPYPGVGNGENTPSCAIDAQGNVIVAFKYNLGAGQYSVIAVTYDAASATWAAPVTLDPGSNYDSEYVPKAAINVDDNGDGIIVWDWFDIDGIVSRVYAASFTNGTWGPSIILQEATSPQSVGGANVVMDRFGNATAMWINRDSSGLDEIYSSSLPFGGAWTAPVIISTTPNNNSNDINLVDRPISVNENGDVMAVYKNGSGVNIDVYSVTKPFGAAWLAPEFITGPSAYPLQVNAGSLSVGIGSCGFALSLWVAQPAIGNNPFQVFASVHSDPLISPCAFIGSQCRERFATQTVYVNNLIWGSCSSDCILFYNLYRNGVLIATIPGTGPYAFRDVVYKNRSTYCLTSINIFGVESPPSCLILP